MIAQVMRDSRRLLRQAALLAMLSSELCWAHGAAGAPMGGGGGGGGAKMIGGARVLPAAQSSGPSPLDGNFFTASKQDNDGGGYWQPPVYESKHMFQEPLLKGFFNQ